MWKQHSIHGSMVDLQRYKATSGERNFIEQSSKFLGCSFSNTDNVRTPIQFRREGSPQHLKRWFFLKNRSIHFHINRTIVTRLVKQNQLIFPRVEINKPLLTPVHSVLQIRFKNWSKFKFFFVFCFNWDSLYPRLNSHYEAWSNKKKSTKKITEYRKSI